MVSCSDPKRDFAKLSVRVQPHEPALSDYLRLDGKEGGCLNPPCLFPAQAHRAKKLLEAASALAELPPFETETVEARARPIRVAAGKLHGALVESCTEGRPWEPCARAYDGAAPLVRELGTAINSAAKAAQALAVRFPPVDPNE